MPSTPTYRTLREAIHLVKEMWPDASSWTEVTEVESLVPDDPSAWDEAIPDAAQIPVRMLLERIDPLMIPIEKPFGHCGLLASWTDFLPG